MSGVRTVATLILVLTIALLSVFQMQIRGFDKVERINEWVLYYHEAEELSFSSNYTVVVYSNYVLVQGFEEKILSEVYLNEYDLLTEDEWQDVQELVDTWEENR